MYRVIKWIEYATFQSQGDKYYLTNNEFHPPFLTLCMTWLTWHYIQCCCIHRCWRAATESALKIVLAFVWMNEILWYYMGGYPNGTQVVSMNGFCRCQLQRRCMQQHWIWCHQPCHPTRDGGQSFSIWKSSHLCIPRGYTCHAHQNPPSLTIAHWQ